MRADGIDMPPETNGFVRRTLHYYVPCVVRDRMVAVIGLGRAPLDMKIALSIACAFTACLLLYPRPALPLSAHGAPARRATPAPVTQIVLLGTGTPFADPARSGPSVAIVVNDTPYIVDFGPGVIRRAAAAHRGGVKGLAMPNLSRAFLTHLHSDHTAGYPDLIFTPWVLDRVAPLEVYGPRGIKAMTAHVLSAYAEDVSIRVNGLERGNRTGHKVIAREVRPGVVYKDQNVTVRAFQVRHGAIRQAFGYRFETPDRTIVISGDTAPSRSVVENCNGCDVLLHEVYSYSGFLKRSARWQKYHSSYHTSAPELAELAKKARPKLLILYHQLFFGSSEEELLREVKERYEGEVVSGHDLDVF